ncbi:hypothetical protein [Sphaerochaeta sp. PS]|uniref:hypothetical protein n=1 Tax=Sphaerochaeta sp. PS TaxID=3076336 RepID=UPI0028A47E64|nr:hypothetical protein [Sphaerochaeta sp. PS]MDT4761162.1 hypothetical protein [Sphaerochaeta sp. PS]
MNKRELKKLLLEFNGISSRLIRVDYQDYSDVLKKFLMFIEGQPVTYDFIIDCGPTSYDVAEEIQHVTRDQRAIIELGSSEKEEVSNIYHILKYCAENQLNIPTTVADSYSSSNKYQDMSDEFNKRVVYVLIGHIRKYLEKIGVDMGMDENIRYSITTNNGQVNLASDHATINATQNNGVDMAILLKLIEEAKKTISDNFSPQEKEEIEESLEAVRDELSQPSPKKGYIKGLANTYI